MRQIKRLLIVLGIHPWIRRRKVTARMDAKLNIQVGRLRSHRDGGWIVVVDPGQPDSPLITRDDGSGLTLAEAEAVMDQLDAIDRDRKAKHKCGVEQLAARKAHNLEAAGSNPAPATAGWCWN